MAYTNTDRSGGLSGFKFWGIAATLLLMWSVGLYNGYTLGGVLHLLVVISAGMVVMRILQPSPAR